MYQINYSQQRFSGYLIYYLLPLLIIYLLSADTVLEKKNYPRCDLNDLLDLPRYDPKQAKSGEVACGLITVWPVIAAAADLYLHNHNPHWPKLSLRQRVLTLLVLWSCYVNEVCAQA